MLRSFPVSTTGIKASESCLAHKNFYRTNRRSVKRLGIITSASSKTSKEMKVEQELNPYVSRLSPSKPAVLSDIARKMRGEGHDVISLAVGEPDFSTPKPIADAAIAAIHAGFTKYTSITGIADLKKGICEKLKNENGLSYTEDCIVVCNGAKQAVWQGIAAACGPGDEVLVPAPYWYSYPEMATLIGAQAKILPTSLSDKFLITSEALENALSPQSRLLVLCSPSNPTGAVYTRDRLEAISEVVKKHPRLIVLADEIYEYMTYAPAEHISIASIDGMYERTLTVNGFSKGFSMTGWRLGYLAGPQHIAHGCYSIQSHTTSGACSISQKAGVAALKMGFKGGETVSKMVEEYKERRDYVVSRLMEMPGVKTIVPDGAFYVFPDVSYFLGDNVAVDGYGSLKTSEDLCTYMIKEAKVVTVPGEAFGAPGYLRISYASSMENLAEAMNRLQTAFQNLG